MSAASPPRAEATAGEFDAGRDEAVVLEPSDVFVTSPSIEEITERALTYLQIGSPVHLSGPAGTGKTTLAFHVAAQLGRPVTLLHGDHEFGSSDLIGRESGYRKSRVVDNFIASVIKFEEEGQALWIDNRITTACRLGHTIIYDEFNRSRPEANNPFLSIFSEGILNAPRLHGRGEGYIAVHPDFRAILTSNPSEYAGVYRAQDALLDRMITIQLGHYDRETEIEITARKSGLDAETARTDRRPRTTVPQRGARSPLPDCTRLHCDRARARLPRRRPQHSQPGLCQCMPRRFGSERRRGSEAPR